MSPQNIDENINIELKKIKNDSQDIWAEGLKYLLVFAISEIGNQS